MTAGEVHDRLVADACFNISAAALIVQTEWNGAGRDWLRAVGNYHSHTPQLHDAYLARVISAAKALFGP
jgi:hypothetical protein